MTTYPWPAEFGARADEWAALDFDVREHALLLASATLSRLTRGRVGHAAIKVRPAHHRRCSPAFMPFNGSGYPQGPFRPGQRPGGAMVNNAGCACGDARGIRLSGPVGRIDAVKVDGVVLAPEKYRLVDQTLLLRTDGEDWNLFQDVYVPDTEPGTLSVTYLNAHPVDEMARYAVGVLALEFAMARTGANGCRLPSSVQRITRAGVTYERMPGMFPGGTTGIDEVDSWLGLYRGMASYAVLNVDRPRTFVEEVAVAPGPDTYPPGTALEPDPVEPEPEPAP